MWAACANEAFKTLLKDLSDLLPAVVIYVQNMMTQVLNTSIHVCTYYCVWGTVTIL